ncbi:MAG: glycosyltransferase [Chitinophagaceae bacterium]
MLLMVIVVCFLVLYTILIFNYWYHWTQLEAFETEQILPSTFLSVVIAARNEENNLPSLLHELQQQCYPQHLFEVIIVDDFSTDKTAEVVQSFLSERVRLIQPDIEKETSSKKQAIATGVQHAKGEWVVITDADCKPKPKWLKTIEAFYKAKEAKFIAAPVQFQHDNSILQLFQTIDFITLQGITAASVAANFHSMCNGANLAYRREAFFEVDGFKNIDKVSSGDDMLLMYKIWKRHPGRVLYLKSNEAIIITQPMFTWRNFVMQRRRWASKTLYYDDHRIMVVLAFVYAFNFFFIVLVTAACINNNWWLVLLFWAGKSIIEFPFIMSVANFYNEKRIMKFFIFFQPLHILYTVGIGLWSQLGKYEWKGRTIK